MRAAYLASPPLVVAYALAGTIRRDLTTEPIGHASDCQPIFLKDLWPSPAEVEHIVQTAIHKDMFAREYAQIYLGDSQWQQMEEATSSTYTWVPDSTYVREPPFFAHLSSEAQPPQDIVGARVLVSLGEDFNTYGTRRGNYEVLARSTWANIRLHNELANGKEGFWTTHQPSGDVMTIFDAAERYRDEGVPLIALAGKEYGSGSSRDTAVKGPFLLGVKAVIAESYERIHRSNLVSMGILPLQYLPGETCQSLGLTGREEFFLRGIATGLAPGQLLGVEVRGAEGVKRFSVLVRVDNTTEAAYLRHGGVLQMVLRQMLKTD